MIKKSMKMIAIVFSSSIILTSCYSYTSVVGEGPHIEVEQKTEVSKWNHYFLGGLIPGGISNSKEMAGGAKDYKVHTRHTFINGLLSAITYGIYTPTTTTVTK